MRVDVDVLFKKGSDCDAIAAFFIVRVFFTFYK